MKINRYMPLFAGMLMLAACKKEHQEPATKAVEFTETSYEYLGAYDSTGTPANLFSPRDAISSDLLSFVNSNIPEGSDLRKKNPDLLSSKSIADIAITQESDVYITFVSQNTGSGNAIAFYTYPTATPPASAKSIKVITYIFPNAGSSSPLQAGDKVKLGRFNAGTSVGFVLLKGAWNSTTKMLTNNGVHFCSNDVLNPEVDPNLKKHTVLINYVAEKKVLIGFEDTDRTLPICDHDFQDIVIYATVTN